VQLISKDIFRGRLSNYFFVLPAIAIFTVFYIIPFFRVFQLSFLEWDGISPSNQAHFVGLSHFKDLLFNQESPVGWWKSMGNAGYITVWALTFQNCLALLLALACDMGIRRGNNLYRVIFFLPPILSEVVIGFVWKLILYGGSVGLFNQFLHFLHMDAVVQNWLGNLDWLGNPKTALTAIALVHSWKGFGWGFIILLAGLQTIPKEMYEAAKIDGANSWQLFTKVTIPMMIPVFVLVVILTILGSMQGFVLIMAMTRGGPAGHTEVPVIKILHMMQEGHRFGYACAEAIIFGIILLLFSLLQMKISKHMKQA